jgi:hypothetical protein
MYERPAVRTFHYQLLYHSRLHCSIVSLTLTARKAQTMGATGYFRHTDSTDGLFGDSRSFYRGPDIKREETSQLGRA